MPPLDAEQTARLFERWRRRAFWPKLTYPFIADVVAFNGDPGWTRAALGERRVSHAVELARTALTWQAVILYHGVFGPWLPGEEAAEAAAQQEWLRLEESSEPMPLLHWEPWPKEPGR